ncbi:hypothetical protein AAHB66_09225 [Leclercia sp. S52]|uniref:hypothetical protein n=1 Tax=Leclercia sp. S52 TaxID=3138178 RepID=UPI00321A7E03
MNKTNKILIGSVSALCIVGTLTLLKALFNDGGKMLTDWISAFSNALMAGAAVYAAMNAKDWLRERKDEDAYILAKDIIFNDLHEFSNVVFEIYRHNMSLDVYTQFTDYNLDVHCNLDECNRGLAISMKGNAAIIGIQRNLRKLSSLGWNLTQKSSKSLDQIRLAYIQLNTNHKEFWTEVKALKLKQKTSLDSPEYVKSKLSALDASYQEFSKCYKSFLSLHKNFDHYFDKSCIKI